MSLDLVVWLSCAVVLPNALPNSDAWRHDRVSPERVVGLPRALADLLERSESWDVERTSYSLRTFYVEKDPIKVEQIQSAFDPIGIRVISLEAPPVSEPEEGERGSAARTERRSQRQSELSGKARNAKLGISLVLEGSYDVGYPEQSFIATHLAEACKGAIVEGPAGYFQVDEHGDWSQ